MVPIPDGALKGGRTQETGRVSDVLGNSLIGGPKRELQNLGKLGKAGTWRAENRETCTSQPINSSQTVAPTRWWAQGTKRSPQKPRGTEDGLACWERHTNLFSVHKTCRLAQT